MFLKITLSFYLIPALITQVSSKLCRRASKPLWGIAMNFTLGMLLNLTLFIQAPIYAKVINDIDSEVLRFDQELEGHQKKIESDLYAKAYEQDLTIKALRREIAQAESLDSEKMQYLEMELEKLKVKMIDNSVAFNKKETMMQAKFEEIKHDNILKSKIIAEYQRELEKFRSGKGMEIIQKENFELASKIRNLELKNIPTIDGLQEGKRAPASVSP